MESILYPATNLHESVTLPFVIPTRISCHTALDKATCAPFCKEGRMKYDNATKYHRKSGGAKPRDLRFYGPVLEMFFNRGRSPRPSSIFTTARHSCSIRLFKADPQLHAKIFPLCASLWVGEPGC